jgi:transposase
MARVIIGMDPHKRSATIEVINGREKVLAQGRSGTDSDGYRAMLAAGRRYPQRLWAVEGCNGIGRHVAQRLVADGETVVDVPAKLSARARVFATGQGRKTDPVDAHSVAVVALRTNGLRQVTVDDATVALRLMVDRRDGLGGPSPTPSTGSTPCCWIWCRAGRRSTCPLRRPALSSQPCGRRMWSGGPAGSWPRS